MKWAKIELEGVAPEIECWNSALVCCLAGSNPPFKVFQGFNPPFNVFQGLLNRVWKEYSIHKVVAIENGFFDKLPAMMQPWAVDMKFDREKIERLPIWVHILAWMQNTGGLQGKVEDVYARLLVEVKNWRSSASSGNEKDELVDQLVIYKWRHVQCSHGKMFRLGEEVCRKKSNIRQVWKPVQKGQEKLSSDSATTHVNHGWVLAMNAIAELLSVSDHTPILLKFEDVQYKSSHFRFCDMWTTHRDFHDIVRQAMCVNVQGCAIFMQMNKLGGTFKQVNRNHFHNIYQQKEALRLKLGEFKPSKRTGYCEALEASDSLIKQQSKANWLSWGDQCTQLFFAVVKQRKYVSFINSLHHNSARLEGRDLTNEHMMSYFNNMLEVNGTD
ncbi:LOW QUALITY PROTEIN: hypothetical protein Cgig2_022800 [Carnegiea gigantea]|uniref:DUF4283 domain-containing protein n=1 Tax=Carnegiea gigantea TaxID=171969 RepID=A0A9Q1KM72_9CARY|nr:LOW QUALITY PROTEIN: hypothetical protein Cgig2_022800 [Carnegiea gigantea]